MLTDPGDLAELGAIGLGMLLAYGPVLGLIIARRKLGALRTATALTVWGAIIPSFEHASFAISGSREIAGLPGVGIHSRYHFFMAGVFSIVAGAMIIILAVTLLRRAEPAGWYAVLIALLIAGGFELSGAGGMLFHGFPPSWAMGLIIYAYPTAWGSALLISYRAVFRGQTERIPNNGTSQ